MPCLCAATPQIQFNLCARTSASRSRTCASNHKHKAKVRVCMCFIQTNARVNTTLTHTHTLSLIANAIRAVAAPCRRCSGRSDYISRHIRPTHACVACNQILFKLFHIQCAEEDSHSHTHSKNFSHALYSQAHTAPTTSTFKPICSVARHGGTHALFHFAAKL